MITVNDKLDIFYKLVYKKEEEKCIFEMKETDKRNNALLNEKRKELDRLKKEFIDKKIYQANIRKNELLFEAAENKKKALLKKKEMLLNDFIDALRDKAKAFTQSMDYSEYLEEKLYRTISEIEDNEIIIILNGSDVIKFKDLIKDGLNTKKYIMVEDSDLDIIGGFILTDKNKTYNLDYSFGTIIEENRYEIGMKLFSLLENVGELNG